MSYAKLRDVNKTIVFTPVRFSRIFFNIFRCDVIETTHVYRISILRLYSEIVCERSMTRILYKLSREQNSLDSRMVLDHDNNRSKVRDRTDSGTGDK